MSKSVDRLSDVLTEMSAKALVTWMTQAALQGMPHEELLLRGNDFVYVLHANFVLLRDVLSETMEDIQQQTSKVEEKLDILEQRLQTIKADVEIMSGNIR